MSRETKDGLLAARLVFGSAVALVLFVLFAREILALGGLGPLP